MKPSASRSFIKGLILLESCLLAVQKKAVLKDILFGGLKETDIPNAVETAFSDLPYANDRQREQKEMDAVNQLMRYAHSEKRITEL